MQLRPFGNTNENVSVIGLGSGFLNYHSYADGIATVRHALELGVNYFDTSPAYGQGASQAIFGEALEGRPEKYLLATKLGYFSQSSSYHSPAAFSAQLDDNLRLLRREQVDVLQVHESDWRGWWTNESPPNIYVDPQREYDFGAGEVIPFLHIARAEGRCRFIGITGNHADDVGRVLSAVNVNAVLIAFCFDLIWRGARTRVLPVAGEKGVAVVLAAVLQNARLAEVRRDWLESPPEWMDDIVRERFAKLYDIQSECGLSLVELSIRFILGEPSVSTILVGAARPEEIEQSVAAAEAGPLPPDLQQALEEIGLEQPHPFF